MPDPGWQQQMRDDATFHDLSLMENIDIKEYYSTLKYITWYENWEYFHKGIILNVFWKIIRSSGGIKHFREEQKMYTQGIEINSVVTQYTCYKQEEESRNK